MQFQFQSLDLADGGGPTQVNILDLGLCCEVRGQLAQKYFSSRTHSDLMKYLFGLIWS